MTTQTRPETHRRDECSFEQLAEVTIPAWVALELISLARQAGQSEGNVEYQGRTSAVRQVLYSATDAALETTGLPGERGEVRSQACTVRRWPADANWQPVWETVRQVRLIRLTGIHRYQAGQPSRFIVDGQWRDEAGIVTAYGAIRRVMENVQKIAERCGAGTFLLGMGLETSGQWKGGGTYLEYAVVPAGLG